MPDYDPPLDPGIREYVEYLNCEGVETFESCQGGNGHAYSEPTIRFHGDRAEGIRALGIALRAGFPVVNLRRIWAVNEGEPTGPWWELTFTSSCLSGRTARRRPAQHHLDGAQNRDKVRR